MIELIEAGDFSSGSDNPSQFDGFNGFGEKLASQDKACIKVIGVGGGGGNAVNNMVKQGIEDCEFMVVNTDLQALARNMAPTKLPVGSSLTKGLGCGANPEIGRNAAIEDKGKIAEVVDGADMVFVTAGMGGGTGTGAAPVIASIARSLGCLTVGVVTRPFDFEGRERKKKAEKGIEQLRSAVDALIVIPNQRLLSLVDDCTTVEESFLQVDRVLFDAVQSIVDIIQKEGDVNADFNDVRTVMSNKGRALMGTGIAEGADRAVEAARQAICSPLLEDARIDGATSVLINITGANLTMLEVSQAVTLIEESAHEGALIIFGLVKDSDMEDSCKVTVIATGFDKNPVKRDDEMILEQQFRRHGSVTRDDYAYRGYQSPSGFNQAEPKREEEYHEITEDDLLEIDIEACEVVDEIDEPFLIPAFFRAKSQKSL